MTNVTWDGAGRSDTMLVGSGAYGFVATVSTVAAAVGLAVLPYESGSYGHIQHGIYFTNGQYKFIHDGVLNGTLTTYASTDYFYICRVGDQIHYCITGTPATAPGTNILLPGAILRTEDALTTETSYLSAILYHQGDTVTGLGFESYDEVDGGVVSFLPMGVAAEESADYTYGGVSFESMTISAANVDETTATAAFMPMVVFGSEDDYTTGGVSFEAMEAAGSDDDIVEFTEGSAVFQYPQIIALGNAEEADSYVEFPAPIAGGWEAADYAEGGVSFEAMMVMAEGVTVYENYVQAVMPSVKAVHLQSLTHEFSAGFAFESLQHKYPLREYVFEQHVFGAVLLEAAHASLEVDVTLDARNYTHLQHEFTAPLLSSVAVIFPVPLLARGSAQVEMSAALDSKNRAHLQHEFPTALLSSVSIEMSARMNENSSLTHEFPVKHVLASSLQVEFDVSFNEYTKAHVQITYPAGLSEGTMTVHDTLPTVTFNSGVILDVNSFDIDTDEGAVHYTGSASLANYEQFILLQQDDPIVITLYGETYNFLVDGKSFDRGAPADLRMQVNLVGASAAYDFPRAEPYTNTWEAEVYAATAANAPFGSDVISWGMVDWLIPEYRLGVDNLSPVAVADKLAKVAGGVLESAPDGSLSTRPLYPQTTEFYYVGATLSHELDEFSHIFAVSEDYVPGKITNRVRITDMDLSYQDVISWAADEDSGTHGVIRAFPSPYRSVAEAPVETTGPVSIVTLRGGVEVVEDLTDDEEGELIEIYAGEGATRHPIHAITSYTWESMPLSGFSFEQGSNKIVSTDPNNNYGLLRVLYTTRYHKYPAYGTAGRAAQFLMNRVEE